MHSDASRTKMQNYAMDAKMYPKGYDGIRGFGIPPHSSAILSVSLISPCHSNGTGCKFKVLSVSTC